MNSLNLEKIVMNQISPNATIGKNCKFGVGVIIDDNVTIGDDNVFGNHVVITGNVEIGSKNFFSDLISIGRPSCHQVMKYEFREPQKGKIKIGNNNIFREFTSFNLPTEKETTCVGNSCFLMPYSHVSHDVIIRDNVVLAMNLQTAGFTYIGQNTFCGVSASTHQLTSIGAFCMIGMHSNATKDIPPGMLAHGNPIKTIKVDKIGLLKKGFNEKDVSEIIKFYDNSNSKSEAKQNLSNITSQLFREGFNDFLIHSTRKVSLPNNRTW